MKSSGHRSPSNSEYPSGWSAIGPFAVILAVLAFTACLFGALLQQPTSQVAPLPEPTASISGRVYRADDGAPVAKAIVSLDRVGVNLGDSLVMRTGPDGSYAFTNLESGTYTIAARHVGLAAAGYAQDKIRSEGTEATWIHVEEGQSINGKDVSLPPCSPQTCMSPQPQRTASPSQWVVSGSLRDEDGDPIENGEVWAVGVQFFQYGQAMTSSKGVARTDDQGNFAIIGTEAGKVYIAAMGIGARGSAYMMTYYPEGSSFNAAQPFSVSPGTVVRDLRMVIKTAPTYTISGKILAKDPGAVKAHYGIVIRSLETDPSGYLHARDPVIARTNGTFTIRGLQAGEYMLIVGEAKREMNGNSVFYQAWPFPRLGEADVRVTNSDVRIEVPIGGTTSIRGTVVVEGEPVTRAAGLRIGLGLGAFLRSMPPGPGYSQVKRDGSFEILGIMPGRFTLAVDGKLVNFVAPPPQLPETVPVYIKRVVCGGADYTEKTITPDPGSDLGECTLTLAKNPATITGMVRDGDKPAPGSVVLLVPQLQDLRENPEYRLTVNADESGRYRIQSVIPGNYLLFAVPPDKGRGYLALDFADRNRPNGATVTAHQNENTNLDLTRFNPK